MDSTPFYINSKRREPDSLNDSDFYYNFVYNIGADADYMLNIDSLVIPRSYYSVNDNNNTFQLDNSGLVGITTGSVSDVVLTNGDYNTTTMIDEVVGAVNNLSIGVSSASLGISMTYSTRTKKFSFLGMTGIDMIMPNDKQKHLGFNYSGIYSPDVNGVIESNSVVDVSGTSIISIITDIDIDSHNNDNKNSNVLARIYPDVDTNGFISYKSDSFRSIKLKSDKLNLQRIQLLDENNDLLDLNGLSWALNLSLTDKNQ